MLIVSLFLLYPGCKEKEEPVVEAEIIISPESLQLNDIDTGFIYLSTEPEKQVSWQVTGQPGRLAIIPENGQINGDIVEVKVISSAEGLDEGTHYADLEFISNKSGFGVFRVFLRTGRSMSLQQRKYAV